MEYTDPNINPANFSDDIITDWPLQNIEFLLLIRTCLEDGANVIKYAILLAVNFVSVKLDSSSDLITMFALQMP